METLQVITLRKNDHLFIFKYERGQEEAVLNQAQEWVKNRHLNFDYFDACLIAHRLGINMQKELNNA